MCIFFIYIRKNVYLCIIKIYPTMKKNEKYYNKINGAQKSAPGKGVNLIVG